MRALSVNFAPKQVWTAPLVAWAVLCGVATSAICLKAGLAWERREAAGTRAEQADLSIRQIEDTLKETRAAAARRPPPAYARDALEMARIAGFPTQSVLRSLEATAVEGIQINAINLDPTRGAADLSVEFSDYKVLLSFIEALNDGQSQGGWSLVRGQEGGQKKQAVVRFSSATR